MRWEYSATAAGGKSDSTVPAIGPGASGKTQPGGGGTNSSTFTSGSPPAVAADGALRSREAGGPAGGVTVAPRLAEILADPDLHGTSASSFAALFERLGIKVAIGPSELGCTTARDNGFECLFRMGNWTKLRNYDLPAILELTLPSGSLHRVALVGLKDETATLAIGGRNFVLPLREIEGAWDGSFILLWKFPFPLREISLGMIGEDVLWVRQTLDTLEGKPQDPVGSNLFDEGLRQRVLDFQRNQSLPRDGLVGTATFVRLTLALLGPNAPSLSRRSP